MGPTGNSTVLSQPPGNRNRGNIHKSVDVSPRKFDISFGIGEAGDGPTTEADCFQALTNTLARDLRELVSPSRAGSLKPQSNPPQRQTMVHCSRYLFSVRIPPETKRPGNLTSLFALLTHDKSQPARDTSARSPSENLLSKTLRELSEQDRVLFFLVGWRKSR